MESLTAKDVINPEVRAVCENRSLVEIAGLLASHHISGVPVVDERAHVIGIVSEADLIDEHKRQAQIPRIALYGIFPVPQDLIAEAYHGGKDLKAQDVMTKRVITAAEDTSVHELAAMMVTRRINRVPIVRDGKLVGIVARADLVRTLATRKEK